MKNSILLIRKLSIVLVLLVLAFASYCQEIEIMIPDDHLDGDAQGVVSDWAESGTNAFPIGEDGITVTQIDVTEHDIFPGMIPVWDEITFLLDNLVNLGYPAPSPTNYIMLYFPKGAYLIEGSLTLKGYIILKGTGGDGQLPEQTHFHFQMNCDNWDKICITMQGQKNGIEDIYIIDESVYIDPISTYGIVTPEYSYDGQYYYWYLEDAISAHSIIKTIEGDIICEIDAYEIVDGFVDFVCEELEDNICYCVTTTFSNLCHTSEPLTHNMLNQNSGDSFNNIRQKQYLNTVLNEGASTVKEPDAFYQNTINISGSNNWVKGVESFDTRRFHIKVTGDDNTISGCYFHSSHDYSDDGGRGYGVDIKGYAIKNRLEDNIFEHLRHAMVIEGDAQRNVVAYNFSTDVHWTGPPYLKKAADLLLHGRPSNAYAHGPEANLLEGNYVERLRVDWVDESTKLPNGPYNTFLRDHSKSSNDGYFHLEGVDEEYKAGQYAQNIIGCNMEPKNNATWNRLTDEDGNGEQYSFRHHYNKLSNSYGELEDIYHSFYNIDKPAFFYWWLSYPYIPYDDWSIPARDRYNYFQPKPINQGWDDYVNICAPPKLKYINKTINGEEEEYKAMLEILFEDTSIEPNNNLVFHSGGDVFINPNTIIQQGSEVIIKAGDVCDGKSNSSKYDIYNNANNINFYNESDVESKYINAPVDAVKSNLATNQIDEIKILPNPNKGEFYIQSDQIYMKNQITLYGLRGKEIPFSFNQNKIHIFADFKGLLFVNIIQANETKVFKVLIQ